MAAITAFYLYMYIYINWAATTAAPLGMLFQIIYFNLLIKKKVHLLMHCLVGDYLKITRL